jgi:hypothetical protein
VPSRGDERLRIEVAFEGGQTIGGLVTLAGADAFRAALAAENGVFDLEFEDGTYVVALKKVVYVKRYSRETMIGFGVVS